MHAAVIVFPGSNCDADARHALEAVAGIDTDLVWHTRTDLDGYDAIVLPGGFSPGDYLRTGAIAARAPIMAAVVEAAERGVPVLGICNGFQVLTEAGLLPGTLLPNAGLDFRCEWIRVRVDSRASVFTSMAEAGGVLRLPIAHGEGNYHVAPAELERLEGDGRVVFRYCEADGSVTTTANPNGSVAGIAGVRNERGNVVGLMPHPERASEPELGGTDGRLFWRSLLASSLADASAGVAA